LNFFATICFSSSRWWFTGAAGGWWSKPDGHGNGAIHGTDLKKIFKKLKKSEKILKE
jgi:hypothetical protein